MNWTLIMPVHARKWATALRGKAIIFIGLILLWGLCTSCNKERKLTLYSLSLYLPELTQPKEIADPDVREFYSELMSDYQKMGASVVDDWEVWIEHDRFRKEDKKAKEKYNNKLSIVKAFESSSKRKIEKFETQSESSFYVKFVYSLKRWPPANNEECQMHEYSFDLKYN